MGIGMSIGGWGEGGGLECEREDVGFGIDEDDLNRG